MRRAVPGTKVGHTGTLDPAAAGLLVLCIGRLTRLARFFADLRKEYSGTILFGRETDTLDLTGRTVRRSAVPADLFERAQRLLPTLTGPHIQTVPEFSAVKWRGKSFHKWVRSGQSPPPRSREAMLFEGEIWREGRSFRQIGFRVVVGSGFYVRSWVRDLGEKLGIPATLCRLVRTKVGTLSLLDALPAREVSRETIEDNVIRGRDVLDWIPSVTFDHDRLRALRDGKTGKLQDYVSVEQSDAMLRVLDPNGDVAALLRFEASELNSIVILRPAREKV